MKAILIPVKLFRKSKKRLAPHYSEETRADLAAALCEDFFRMIAQVRGVDGIFIVTQEPRALALARDNGWDVIPESEQISESHSVDAASRFCAERGVDALLRLPIDIPLATAPDIEAILAEAEDAPSAVIVPSHEGTGTNALLRSPPTLFRSHFGPNSFALHLEEAKRCSAKITIRRNARVELDIDEINDLKALAGRVHGDSATARWIARNCAGLAV